MLTTEPQAAGQPDQVGDPEVETQGTAQDVGDSDPSGTEASDPVADLVEEFSETAKPEDGDDHSDDQAAPDDDKSKQQEDTEKADKPEPEKAEAEKPKPEPTDLTPEERKTIGKKASKKFDSLLADRKADREALAKVSEIAKTADPFLKHAEKVGLIARDETGIANTKGLSTWLNMFGEIDQDPGGAAIRLRGIADKIDPNGAVSTAKPMEMTAEIKAALDSAESLGEDMAPIRALFAAKPVAKPEPAKQPEPQANPQAQAQAEAKRQMEAAYEQLADAASELEKKHPLDWPKIRDAVSKRVSEQAQALNVPPPGGAPC